MSAIFISHSSADNDVSSKLIERLEDQGHHSVFLDFDPEQGIPAGTNWEQVLYAKLRACRAVIVLCSPHSMASKWCFAEITHARSLGKSLFPVMVAPCDLKSVFSDTQVLDLSDENNYKRLWRGLKEAGLEDVFDWDGKRDPYPGLNAFQEQDAALFFGRSEDIHKGIDLLKKIRRSGAERLLLYLGASGSGKSSLVRAGLIPRLKKDQDNWVVVDPFRSNELLSNPFFNLASVISAAFKRYESIQDIKDIYAQLLITNQSPHPLLQQACSLAIAADKREASVLIFIDQFEELLGTSNDDSNNEQPFLEWLGDAINQAQKIPSCPLIVVATIRSDFFVDLQRAPALQNVDYAEFSVKTIPKSGLGELIEGPAELAGLELEPGLVPQIIEDIETQNALPLLAFTLAELWKRYGQDGDMTLTEYKQLGGVRGSVKKAAEDAFPDEQLSAQQEADLRRAFLAMVQVGEANQYRRKKAELNELPKDALPMLEKLVETRLLVKSETGNTYEVAHESLFQEWGMLQKWLTENREFLGWRRRFRVDLQKWEDLTHDEGALLRGASLAEAEGWFKDHQIDLSEMEQSFFKISIGLRDREEQERLEQQSKEKEAQEEKIYQALALSEAEKKTARNFKWFTGVALILLLIASAIAWYAFDQRQKAENQTIIAKQKTLEAEHQTNIAKQQVLETNYNIAKVFEEKAGQNLLKHAMGNDGKRRNLQKAWLYTTAALAQKIAIEKQALTFDSVKKLFNPKIIRQLFTQRWFSSSLYMEFISSVAFSPDGKTLVSGSRDKSVRLWDVSSGKQIKQFNGHTDTVISVAFSPDGKTLVSGSSDKSVRLWDVSSGKQIKQFVGHTDSITSVAFSPDGKTLVSGARDNSIRLRDVSSGKQIKQFNGHTGWVNCVTFSPDGKILVSGSSDRTVRLWEVVSGRQFHQITGPSGGVTSVAFSPDGRSLVFGATDKTIYLYPSGKQIQQLKGHTGSINSVAFSPDGKTLVSGSSDKTVRLWDVSSGKQIKQFNGHTEGVDSVAFSPDGKVLVSNTSKAILLWDVASAKPINGPAYLPHDHVAFSPDGKTLVSGSSDNTVRLWNVASGKQIKQFAGHTEWVTSVAFSSDGKTLVSGSSDKSVRLWDVSSGKQLKQFAGNPNPVTSVAFSPDGKTLVSGSDDITVRLWEVSSGKQIKQFVGHTDSITSVAFSPDGKTLVSGSEDKSVGLWEVSSGKQIKQFVGHTDSITSVAFSPDGKTLVSGARDNTIRLWDVSFERQPLHTGDETDRSVAFSPDGKTLVSGASKGSVRLWDLDSGKQIKQFVGHTDTVLSVAFSPDGKTLVSGSGDKSVRLWDVSSGKQIKQFNGHTDTVISVAFSPDGKTLVSGSRDKSVRLWDVSSGKQIKQLNGHTEWVNCVTFSPDGKTLVSGSKDKSVRLWDVSSGKQIKQFNGHTDTVISVAFSPDGKTLVSGSKDKSVRLWDVSSGKQIKQFNGHTDTVLSVAFSPDGKFIISGSFDSTVRIWDEASGKQVQQFDDWYGRYSESWGLRLSISPDGKTLVFVTAMSDRFH